MGDAQVIERIAEWEAAGVIDAAVAARLRAAETATPDPPAQRNPVAAAAAVFGPPITIAEMFGYLGTAFLIAAWYTVVGKTAQPGPDGILIWALGHGIVAVVFAIIGVTRLRGSARSRRAAGAAFLVSAASATAAIYVLIDAFTALEPEILSIVAAAGGLVVIAAFRRMHPALLTQFGLLVGVTTLAVTIQGWVERALYPADQFGAAAGSGPDPLVRVLLMAGWWLLVALVVGLIGRREAATGTIDGDRRAAMSRAWAGFLAVIGVTAAVFISRYDPSTFESRRVLEPVIGDVAILLVSAVLLERAFRREASAFVFPAALGVIIALTDLNASYLVRATSTEIGLLVEGVILLVAGLVFDRLRRRVSSGSGAPNGPSTPVPPQTEPAAAPSP